MNEGAKRVQAGKAAREAIDLIGWDTPEDERHYWYTIASEAAAKAGCKIKGQSDVSPHPMTDEEARRFERTRVPFGQYSGVEVGDVPVDYWLAVVDSAFNRQLVRYLRSDRFQRQSD